MPRVCAGGCGKPLRDKKGRPDYHRFFCDDCAQRDRTEKLAIKRRRHALALERRCARCPKMKQMIAVMMAPRYRKPFKVGKVKIYVHTPAAAKAAERLSRRLSVVGRRPKMKPQRTQRTRRN